MRNSPSFETLAALALWMRNSANIIRGLIRRSRPKGGVSKGEAAICESPPSGGSDTRAAVS
jgi:hypothetical protein